MAPIYVFQPQILGLDLYPQLQLPRGHVNRFNARFNPQAGGVYGAPNGPGERVVRRLRGFRGVGERKVAFAIAQRGAGFFQAQRQRVVGPIPCSMVRVVADLIGMLPIRERPPDRSLNIIRVVKRVAARAVR